MKLNRFGKSVALICAISCISLPCMAEGAAEFSEDFNRFKLHISYNGPAQNNIINSGKPSDGDYSDAEVYPDGEESIYEGNAANNLYVFDSKGNKIYGGIDGWTGHYHGAGGDYNRSNRRLTVRNDGKFASNNVLSFEPAKSSDGAYSSFAKEDIDLSGVSVWETDVAIATPGSGTADDYSVFTLSITKNPISSGYEYESTIPLVQFATKNQAANAAGEIRIFDSKVYDIKVISMYSSSKMYRVKYVLDNSGNLPMHWVVIKDGDTVVASTEPAPVQNYEEFFSEDAVYGILYRADIVYNKISPRYLIDNISFSKAEGVSITNIEEIESEKYPVVNPQITLEFDNEVYDVSDDMITVRDSVGEIVPATVESRGNNLIITPDTLKPQEHYTAELKNIPYGDKMYTSKTVRFHTLTSISTENAVREGNSVKVTLKNNCSSPASCVILLTAMKDKVNAASGIYYKRVSVPAMQSAEATIENIILEGTNPEDVKFNVFVIDSLTGMHGMSAKYEF